METNLKNLMISLAAITGLLNLQQNIPTAQKISSIQKGAEIADEIVIEDKLDLWLDKLATYENCPPEGILDVNKKLSFSAFCFQEATFKYFVKKYNLLPHAEDHEIMNFISDNEFQRKLVKMIIKEDNNNWKLWWTSVAVRGLPKPPKVL